MLFLTMPAFSAAIFCSVSPSSAVCSSPMLVMMLRIGTTMFVASSRPPSPVSIHLDVALREVVEGHRRGHFEERQLQIDHLFAVLVHEVHHLLLGNHLAVHADPFAEVLQVGRGEEPRAVAGLLEHRGDDVRYGALAVGSRDMDGEEVALRIAQVAAECGDALQSRLVGRRSLGFEGGQRREEEFEGLGVIHGVRCYLTR